MELLERIVVDPEVVSGKPAIRGTRISVSFVVDLLAQGWSLAEILENYTGIETVDIQACLAYASSILESERVYPL
ncbi:MAG: DUF433 domain-containing protein [Thermoanaerobaculales bacterium]|nr:DUF433 domain-containing protein [Thermoanaerobaculales bacterium]